MAANAFTELIRIRHSKDIEAVFRQMTLISTVHAIKKHLIRFLGLTELTIKYDPGDFHIKLYRMAPKPGGKSNNFAITTDDQWKLQLPSMLDDSMLDDSGSEMNSMYSWY